MIGPDERRLREELVATARKMQASGLVPGTSGNLSARWGDGMLITPSGLPYDQLTAEDVSFVAADGTASGPFAPSSEWRIHHDVLAARPEAGAILHAHAMFATALACCRRSVPAFHYMVAVAGGADIRCADYATFGTQALSDAVVQALAGRRACLMANHGLLVLGPTLAKALALAEEVETLCAQYWRCLQIGEPEILDAAEMAVILDKFKSYGQAKPSA